MNGMTVCHKTPHRSPNLKTIEPEWIIKHKHSHSPKSRGKVKPVIIIQRMYNNVIKLILPPPCFLSLTCDDFVQETEENQEMVHHMTYLHIHHDAPVLATTKMMH